ncbi:MAG: bifunctional riboflavin kinase/FAD synthetase [Pseudomonadales bacterium]|nr:bifunctional riboflavin kinase/FAD synthetase [Pseudomonadales bacterium]
MQIIDNLSSFQEQHGRCVATIGKYDGMHLGHQSILRRLLELAGSHALPSLVVLSEPQPEEFFAGSQAPARLNHFVDKVNFLRDFGVDLVYRLTFNQALSQLSPQAFVERILVAGLGVESIVVGSDFRFGRDRAGDLALLTEQGRQLGFGVHEAAPVCSGDQRISSTLVRQCLQMGDCAQVRQLLGRAYSISGVVVQGRQLARQLGAPTANIRLETASIALQGVYAVNIECRGRLFQGVANIGYKPTVETGSVPSLEVFLFDFEGDLYGDSLQVSFLEKLRDEKKFSDLDALKQQISRDVDAARGYFSRLG